MTDFIASCPVGCMWNESEGGENVPVDVAPDDRLDVSNAVEHRGEGTGKYSGEGGGMTSVVNLTLGKQ